MTKKTDYFMMMVWTLALALDFCKMAAGESPSWFSMVIAHICLILCYYIISTFRRR